MVRRIVVSICATMLLASLLGSVAGCNTMADAGQDIEQGGKAIKDEAREMRSKM